MANCIGSYLRFSLLEYQETFAGKVDWELVL